MCHFDLVEYRICGLLLLMTQLTFRKLFLISYLYAMLASWSDEAIKCDGSSLEDIPA